MGRQWFKVDFFSRTGRQATALAGRLMVVAVVGLLLVPMQGCLDDASHSQGSKSPGGGSGKASYKLRSPEESQAALQTALDVLSWDLIKGDNQRQDDVWRPLGLVTTLPEQEDISVSWTMMEEDLKTVFNTADGSFQFDDNRPSAHMTLLGTISLAGYGKNVVKKFDVVLVNAKELWEAELALSWENFRGSNTDPKEVVQRLNLITSMPEYPSVTVQWVVMDDAQADLINLTDGSIFVPENQYSIKVDLKAVLTQGTASAEKHFEIVAIDPNWFHSHGGSLNWNTIRGDNIKPLAVTAPLRLVKRLPADPDIEITWSVRPAGDEDRFDLTRGKFVFADGEFNVSLTLVASLEVPNGPLEKEFHLQGINTEIPRDHQKELIASALASISRVKTEVATELALATQANGDNGTQFNSLNAELNNLVVLVPDARAGTVVLESAHGKYLQKEPIHPQLEGWTSLDNTRFSYYRGDCPENTVTDSLRSEFLKGWGWDGIRVQAWDRLFALGCMRMVAKPYGGK